MIKYHYYFGDYHPQPCSHKVEIVEGPAVGPNIIRLEGDLYRRVEVLPNQSGQRGQCNECVFSIVGSGKCPPVHGCSPNQDVRVDIYSDYGSYIKTMAPGKTTHHIRWEKYFPEIVNKIEIVNVEI